MNFNRNGLERALNLPELELEMQRLNKLLNGLERWLSSLLDREKSKSFSSIPDCHISFGPSLHQKICISFSVSHSYILSHHTQFRNSHDPRYYASRYSVTVRDNAEAIRFRAALGLTRDRTSCNETQYIYTFRYSP